MGPIEGMRLLARAVDLADRAFTKQAACLGLDPGIFHPDDEERQFAVRVAEAKKICADCVVQVECLEYALKYGETKGVWGGSSERDRRTIQKRRRKKVS